jgi:hypothetical protein
MSGSTHQRASDACASCQRHPQDPPGGADRAAGVPRRCPGLLGSRSTPNTAPVGPTLLARSCRIPRAPQATSITRHPARTPTASTDIPPWSRLGRRTRLRATPQMVASSRSRHDAAGHSGYVTFDHSADDVGDRGGTQRLTFLYRTAADTMAHHPPGPGACSCRRTTV